MKCACRVSRKTRGGNRTKWWNEEEQKVVDAKMNTERCWK